MKLTRVIIITGDFNEGVDTLFEHELVELCKCEHLYISDYELVGTQQRVLYIRE